MKVLHYGLRGRNLPTRFLPDASNILFTLALTGTKYVECAFSNNIYKNQMYDSPNELEFLGTATDSREKSVWEIQSDTESLAPVGFRYETFNRLFSRVVRNEFADQGSFNTPLFPCFDKRADDNFSVSYFYNNHGLKGLSPYYKNNRVCQAGEYPPSRKCTTYVFGKYDRRSKRITEMVTDLRSTDRIPKNNKFNDSHGSAILDIDGDGLVDMYSNNGSSNGRGVGIRHAASLFWGRKNSDGVRWSGEGGQGAALAAGLGNRGGTGRGRGVYFADFNGDGKLDVLLVNTEMSIKTSPKSEILYNLGRRKFRSDPSFQEYIFVPLLAGQGKNSFEVQDRLIVQRDKCSISISGQFCTSHPEGSWAEYKYDHSKKKMVMVRYTEPVTRLEKVKVLSTGDFDGDGVFDLFFCSVEGGISFIYSKQTRGLANRFSIGVSENIPVPPSLELSRAIVNDFDLDGTPDVMAIYKKGSRYLTVLYKRNAGRASPPYWSLTNQSNIPPIDYARVTDIATADYNNDGLPDIVIARLSPPYQVHMTNTNRSRPRVTLVLRGFGKVNLYGIGSALRLTVYDRARKKRLILYRSVNSYSHGSTSKGGATDHRIVFGLGTSKIPIQLEIKWPNNVVQKVNKGILMKMKNGQVIEVKYNR